MDNVRGEIAFFRTDTLSWRYFCHAINIQTSGNISNLKIEFFRLIYARVREDRGTGNGRYPLNYPVILCERTDIMNEVKLYEDERFGNIRILEENGKVLFCGKDIAEALGYSNPRDALIRHCRGVVKRDGVTLTTNQHGVTSEQTVEMSYIPEGDVYRLIASSRLPQAQEFEAWIFDDVLPSIRKHGAYIAPDTIEKILHDPDTLINLAQQLKAERAKVAELTPKAEYYDTVAASEGSLNFRETAKILGIPEKKFIAAVEKHKLCYRNADKKLIPYAQRIDSGWFEVKEVPYLTANGTRTTAQTLITPLGREKIFAIIKGKN